MGLFDSEGSVGSPAHIFATQALWKCVVHSIGSFDLIINKYFPDFVCLNVPISDTQKFILRDCE